MKDKVTPETVQRMLRRRDLLKGFAAGAAVSVLGTPPLAARTAAEAFHAEIADLEKRHGGRLGVAVQDAAGGQRVAHRADERFLMCSTLKFPLAGLILSRVDAGEESLDRHITYDAGDVVTYSPETGRHVGTGMTLGAICRAGLTLSDNTAANLMLRSVGGPAALTAFVRALDDTVTRSDRYETALNAYTPGSDHDTTSPSAMGHLMQRLLLDDVLSAPSRGQLTRWLIANETGDHRLRAGMPGHWRIGDKTGSGGNNTANDIAIVWPQPDTPVIVSAYYAGSDAGRSQRDRVLADVGRATVRWLGTG